MKIKTSELSDEKLDLAVSIVLGHRPEKDFHSHGMTWKGWWETATYIDTKPDEYRRLPKYSTDWSEGGPIIERERITIDPFDDFPNWCATIPGHQYRVYDPALLIAAMRCYVASKLGDEVEIPEELT